MSHITKSIAGGDRDTRATAAQRLLLTAREAAATCGKSVRTWRTWDAAGLIPAPVRIGHSTLWSATELRQWVTAGCPKREEWEVIRAADPEISTTHKKEGRRDG